MLYHYFIFGVNVFYVIGLIMKNENQVCKEWLLADTIHPKHKFKEEQSSDGCSYFFKVLLGDFSQKLRIPPAFIPKLIHETEENMVLHDPSGHQWVVKLCGTSTGLEFGQGWENFVHDQRLEFGDFLMFKYISRSKFKVRIFGRSGCVKTISVGESEQTHDDLQKRCPTTLTDDEEKHGVAENQGKITEPSSSSPRITKSFLEQKKASRARRRRRRKKEEEEEKMASERLKKKDGVGTRIELCCTAIQMFLMESTSGSEKCIREMFGDNPDTSKALRMLLKMDRVRRFGSGGRSDPFVYIALNPPGLNELEQLKDANATKIRV